MLGRRFRSALAAGLALAATAAAPALAQDQGGGDNGNGNAPCRLAHGARHVVYIVFDNTHLLRDNPNVPSDLEQMPHLRNFLRDNGSLLSNQHTPLIAHTAGDIITGLTGVYPDRNGLNVSNSYGYYSQDRQHVSFPSAFTYWTDKVQVPDATTYNMVNEKGKNDPAPWVPYTRAGCNVGVVAAGNMAPENINTDPNGDVTKIYGTDSAIWKQADQANKEKAQNPPNYDRADVTQGDVIGLAVHCARGAAQCTTGQPDVLPDEPGGYAGYKGLFGAFQVNPLLTGKSTTTDANGNIVPPAFNDLNGQQINAQYTTSTPGFPGFDALTPAVSLSYTASMLERGMPVTYSYVSDAHDAHGTGHGAYGPGEAGYVAQLKAYDDGFAKFFARLRRDGIDQSNTLFVVTNDEGDHFAGPKPTNAGCDGVTTPCQYDHSHLGEVNANLRDLLAQEKGNTTPFDIHYDSAPAVYIHGQPDPASDLARQLERDTGGLFAPNPIVNEQVYLTHYMADPVEQRLLHMLTSDNRRTPSFVQFADPNYYLETYGSCPGSGSAHQSPPEQPGCAYTSDSYAWSHGDKAAEINRTWLGMVGPGVRTTGQTARVWGSHTDTRPTMMALLGLKDDYSHDGRVLTEVLSKRVTASDLRTHPALALQRIYTQLQSPVGRFGDLTLEASTGALKANTSGDPVYRQCSAELQSLGDRRDRLAAQIGALLERAAFAGGSIDRDQARSLSASGEALLDEALTAKGWCT